MTKQERLAKKETIKEMILNLRAQGKRYEEIAVESGVSIDTLRRILYCKKNIPGQITIRKIINYLSKNA
ncbi:hypothetical protein [Thermodesulfovibrio sp. TK110]